MTRSAWTIVYPASVKLPKNEIEFDLLRAPCATDTVCPFTKKKMFQRDLQDKSLCTWARGVHRVACLLKFSYCGTKNETFFSACNCTKIHNPILAAEICSSTDSPHQTIIKRLWRAYGVLWAALPCRAGNRFSMEKAAEVVVITTIY